MFNHKNNFFLNKGSKILCIIVGLIHFLVLLYHWVVYLQNDKLIITILSLKEFTMIISIFLTILSITLWNFKGKWINALVMYLHLTTCMYGLCFSKSLLLFFFFYELLLLPSSALLYYTSPNIRSAKVWYYFLLWTQIGSFLIFIGFIYLYYYLGISNFQNLTEVDFSGRNNFFIFLILLGFFVKVPVWPFDFWLTKTHVEANTGFSIYLSGVLVKSAFIGLLKVKILLIGIMHFIAPLLLFSSLAGAIRLFIIIDFKKFIATTTIIEMPLLVLLLLQNTYNTTNLVCWLVWYHSFSSALLFLLSEFIYVRYSTRNITQISGMVKLYPILSGFVFLTFLLITAFPLTIKFVLEYKLLLLFANTHGVLLILFILIFQLLLTIVSAKVFFGFLMGDSKKFKMEDLNMLDVLKISILLIFLILPVLFI